MADKKVALQERERSGTEDFTDGKKKESKSTLSRIRLSFTTSLKKEEKEKKEEAKKAEPAKAPPVKDGNVKPSEMKKKMEEPKKEKEVAFVDDVSAEDKAEIEVLIQEGKDPDTRRNALLGLFKISLRDELANYLVHSEAIKVCLEGALAESKGGGARRAGVQAIRNITAATTFKKKMLSTVTGIATIIEEESPGSGPREAALEALSNLASEKQNRVDLAMHPKLMSAIMNASRTEKEGAREAAMNLLEKLSEYDKASKSGGLVQTLVNTSVRQSKMDLSETTKEESENGEEINDVVEIKSLVNACLTTLQNEQKGSGARVSAMKTLRNLSKNLATHPFMMAVPNFTDIVLKVVNDESPGSETRSLIFLLFADLALSFDNRTPLMRTKDLVETVILAVRDEAPQSLAREGAMYTVARLCIDAPNRPVFMKADGLVPVCIKAAQQEPQISGGRAAALEMLAGLALGGKENQSKLFATPGVVAMAVEGAACVVGDADGREERDKKNRMMEAGLDLIASLSLLRENQMSLVKTKGLFEVIMDVVCRTYVKQGEMERAAGLNAARCFLSSDNNEIKQMFKKHPKFEMAVVNAVVEEEFTSRARGEAMGILFFLYLDDNALWVKQDKMFECLVGSVDMEIPGSEVRFWAFQLANFFVQHGHVDASMMDLANNLCDVCGQIIDAMVAPPENIGGPDFRRVSLRRAPRAKITQDIKSNPDSVAAMEKDRALALETIRVCCACLPNMKLSESLGSTLFEFVKDCKAHKDAVNALDAVLKSSYVRNAKSFAETESKCLKICTALMNPGMHLLVIDLMNPATLIALEMFAQFSYIDACLAFFEGNKFEAVLKAMLEFEKDKNAKDKDKEVAYVKHFCTLLLNLLFHSPISNAFKIHELRTKIEKLLQSYIDKGADEEIFFEVSKISQAIFLSIRFLGTERQRKPGAPNPKVKKVSVLGNVLVQPAEKFLKSKSTKQLTYELSLVTTSWKNTHVKKRKQIVSEVFDVVMDSSDISLFFLSSFPAGVTDCVLYLLLRLLCDFKFENKICVVGGLERDWLVKYSKFVRIANLSEEAMGEEIVKQLTQ